MNDRIHINDLRRMVEATTGDLREIIAALVDLAEAAHSLDRDELILGLGWMEAETNCDTSDEHDQLDRLEAALARFEFGDRATEGANR